MRMKTRRIAIISLVSALLSLAGCNTIAGVREDISGSARAVQHSL